MSPAPGLIHENVRATLSPASGIASTSRRSSSELERSTLDLAHNERRPSFRQSSSRSRGQQSSPPSQDPADLYVSSSDQGNDSELSESLAGTDASGSHILSGSVIFHEPTIKRQHNDGSAARDVDSISRADEAAPARTSGKRTADENSSKTAAIEKTDDTQQSDSFALGGLMRAGAMPIQRASGFIMNSGKRVSGLFGSTPMEYYGKFSGMIAGGKKHYAEADGLVAGEEIQDSEDELTVRDAEKSFRNHFALPESERLVATFFGFFHRVLPLYGKLYIGSTKLCFRSFFPGNWTKVCSHNSQV